MKSRINEFISSLLTRKFLLTVAGSYALYSAHQYGEIVVLLLGYIGVEGGADIVGRYKSGSLRASDIDKAIESVSESDNYEVDTSKVETGKPAPMPLVEHDEPKK